MEVGKNTSLSGNLRANSRISKNNASTLSKSNNTHHSNSNILKLDPINSK